MTKVGFFVKQLEARTISMKQLAVVLSPGNKLKSELLLSCVIFFKLKL